MNAPHGIRDDAPPRDTLPPNTYLLRCLALPGLSRRLGKAAVALLAEAIADADLLYNIDLALTEACANVVRHAYPHAGPGNLEIVLTLAPDSHVEVEVADWGVGFSTWPVVVENAHPEAEGGRGLFIMSRLASHFECRKGHHRNSVFMRMQVAPEQWHRQWAHSNAATSFTTPDQTPAPETP
ncbi:ATP-binding protein [Megalodesulfovibrio gigas]|uniref:Putative ATP-binding region ATPase domain protein n=1 Tax=Megalodesulfovibrio gigas (strain ATCC 19364 / DSM 1382 / NCIMB 9332 / VKM B-1759) TaxID=1121448 RepID=T2G771_MEGG1|nr:ATP-binding protein [Megalodesulfovibrio gigas]AGW12039.1 putative ATP-binding region ATPase domain protein [Megalodesulfovibrio gigas DSM 1382 = ATCC 19364]